ncbi:hypothetical protein Celaphus_00011123 [Cervus elaphus hippelaphus]|uniref:PRAME n=1 Tax=Cervus elaphus hippelaphus TaxID=46360 RepID=A0A212CRS7_CEREH|nr:hypothetical protein Celaphus_00011123 [Cervus elaphus hippelaphus]
MENITKVLNMMELDCIQEKQEQYHFVQITSQFLRLGHLQDLHLESPSFLEGCLDQLLRRPWKNLSITNCQLTESDLTHLSQHPNISQLKDLDLGGVWLVNFNPELLQVLLEKVAATLQELYLDECGNRDSQFEANLPALSRCSHLKSFNLSRTSCPRPSWRSCCNTPESYSPEGVPLEGRLAQVWTPLMEIMRNLVQPKTIRIFLSPCPYHSDDI